MFTVCENIKKTNGVIGSNSSEIDTHMMKNIEWGAVAILSQSKYGVFNPKSANKGQIWNNSNIHYKTGQAGSSVDSYSEDATSNYNAGNGPKASTTGTVYGIYDMAGCRADCVMGILGCDKYPYGPQVGSSYKINTGFSGLLQDGSNYVGIRDLPDPKYYDLYPSISSPNSWMIAGKIGDCTRELLPRSDFTWNEDFAKGPYASSNVVSRGLTALGTTNGGPRAGVFGYYAYPVNLEAWVGFRPILISL